MVLILILGLRRYFCPNGNCGKNYKSLGSLKFHKNHECGVAPEYHCYVPLCYKSFTRNSSFKKHMEVVHKQIIRGKIKHARRIY